MSFNIAGIQAYQNAIADFKKTNKQFEETGSAFLQSGTAHTDNTFADTLRDSLANVNDLQTEKANMIEAFASGENQNVHELMISMQKASLAVSMTSAVRNKVIEAYRELSKMQF